MTSYKIKEGECLSLIAQKFNVDLKKLQQLNAEQIKNLDLIYAGDVIEVPIDNKPGTRQTLPEFPKCKADQCTTVDPNFVDILYVPAHPKTGKKTWYGLTKEAQQAIKDEQKNLSDAIIPKAKEATFQNLNKLGLLSIFNHCPYEMFLDDDETQRYRFLLAALMAIRSQSAQLYKKGEQLPPGEKAELEGFVIQIGTTEGMDTEKLQKEYYQKARAALYCKFGGKIAYLSGNEDAQNKFNNLIDSITRSENFTQRLTRKLVTKVTRHLEKEIRKLERIAVKKAGDIKTEDGTRFVYDKKEQYFTSQQQKKVQSILNELKLYRQYTDDDLALDGHKISTDKIQFLWTNTARAAEYLALEHDPQKQREIIPPLGTAVQFTRMLLQLNGLGYLVKEQCLTMAELEGTSEAHLGPKAIRKLGEWREKKWFSGKTPEISIEDGKKLTDALKAELGDNFGIDLNANAKQSEQTQIKQMLYAKGCVEWGFYPCLAIVKLVDATMTMWMKDLKQLLNNLMPAPQMFRVMLWLKKLALARISFLKEETRHRALKAERLQYLYLKQNDAPKSFYLLWEEEKFRPREKRLKVFYAKNGQADLQAVECVLLSEGEVGWVRAPGWYLPEDEKAEKRAEQFIRNITQKVEVVGPNAGQFSDIMVADDLPGALNAMKQVLSTQAKNLLIKQKFVLNALSVAASVSKDTSAFWQASYHWQDGVSPDGKNGTGYVVDAEAQFMRLSTKASGTINTPLSEIDGLSPNMDLTGGVSIESKLTLLSGQLAINSWFPLPKKGAAKSAGCPAVGYQYLLPYYKNDSENREVPDKYNVGEFFLKLSSVTYGVAAASFALSGNLSFGQSSADGEIGVKGQAISVMDFNEPISNGSSGARVKEYQNRLTADTKLAGQGVLAVNLFAGVEAGEKVSAQAFWRPPVSDGDSAQDVLELGGICTQLGVNAGIGFSAQLRIAFEGGTMYLIAAAKIVCGPGVSGTMSVSLNPVNADRLIAHLLNLLKLSGFKRLALLGEPHRKSNRDIDYGKLNDRLTLAVQMGLTLGEVLLLPPVVYANLQESAKQEAYAPVIARNIISNANKSKIQHWVKNLPPESLSKLLDCLSNTNETHLWQWKETKKTIGQQEIQKAQAINQVLSWIQPGKDTQETEQRCRQFEKTLSLMGTTPEAVMTPRQKWQQFNHSWIQLAEFMNGLPEEVGSDTINEIKRYFLTYTQSLCTNMRRYHFIPRGLVHSKVKWEVYSVERPEDDDNVIEARNLILKKVQQKKNWKQESWTL